MITSFNEFRQSLAKPADRINESTDTTYAKGLSDSDEMRPARMKSPSSEYSHDFPLHGKNSRGLYIQDDLNDMLIDKYGKERGDAMFKGILEAPRHGAFFQLGDKLAREKSKMMHDLGVHGNGDYFQYSYFSLWKAWMDKNGYKYVIPTPEEVEAKKAIKIAAEELAKEKERQAQVAKRTEDDQRAFDSKMSTLRQRFGKLLDIKPDSKDLERLKDVTSKSSWSMGTYVQKMANSIKDATKAARRGTAIISLIGSNVSKYNALNLAEVFFNRAMQLGAVTEGIESDENSDESRPKYAGQRKVADDIEKRLKRETSPGAINAADKRRREQNLRYYAKLKQMNNKANTDDNDNQRMEEDQ